MASGSTSLWTPGPAEIAVGFGNALSPPSMQYLGTTTNGARSRKMLYTGNVQGDPAGVDGMPLDVRLSGRGIVTVMQINKFDPAVMQLVEGRFFGGAPGGVGINEIGSLAITEGLTVIMMIRSRYAATHSAFSGYTPGLRLLWALVTGEVGEDRSTKEQVMDLTFTGFTNLLVAPSNDFYGTCWDNDISTILFPAAT